jgi:alpha-glucosidase
MITTVQSGINKKLSNSLGTLLGFEHFQYGIEGKTTFGQFRITLYSDHIIRIQATLEEYFEESSYAVVAKPGTVDFAVEEVNDHLLISTAELVLQVQKNPVRFTLLNKKGQVVNEDDKGFGTSWIGEQTTTYKKMQEGERFIGLGEKTGPLDRRGHGYQNWNTDHFAYGVESDPLYASTPFYLGIHSGLSYGLFFDNSHKTHFNFGASNDRFSSFSADLGEMNYYLIHHDTVAEILQSYTRLTGRMEMPPIWSLGYQQCRYSYYPDKEVLSVAKTFREKDIPADVIVLDIHYMEEYKIFTWSGKDFPDPEGLIKSLRDMGFHVVVMCDPGIKIQEGYEPYDDGKGKNVFLKYPDGTDYSGEVWPGWCHFPDFTNPKTREWWGEKFKSYTDLGVKGFWNDMNEIATWGQMLPELIEFDFEGEKGTTRKGRNLYGFLMARATYEGAKKQLAGERPFNLTRAGYSGIQRYAALWTGDNVASEEHMMAGVRLVNSLGLAGVPFTGYDVGGFAGDASPGLFARWLSIGAFSPFFRGHSMINSRDAEPWAFGEEVEQISRNYINLRYKLMPYIYSAFYESSQNGLPIARSLAIDYTHDAAIYDPRYENQYLFGPHLLVAPLESNKDIARVYLPEGIWYDLHTGTPYQGGKAHFIDANLEKLPVFVKGGGIIPMQSRICSHAEQPESTLTLHVYAGGEDSLFIYYEDDGHTFRHQQGEYFKRAIYYHAMENEIVLNPAEGSYESKFNTLKVVLHGFSSVQQVKVNGQSIPVNREQITFLEQISSFDPKGKQYSIEKEHVQVFTLPHLIDQQVIVL